ncbi:uncharacterized protein LOC131683968 [Topomyia yanbarensis]|uniref:uncharacterized protein LOC131683968 n=1 Tax=Topomyia yanbarensis TaxID=2498891 RepID=UPI00273B7427|nr:uncharacterized protein LOC131683968 [Topomyia yanbarensis]
MSHCIADSETAPGWLHNDFLLEVIRKAQNDPSLWLCHGCKLRPEAVHGDRRASVLFRTTVHYRSKRFHNEQAINLITKIIPSENGLSNESSILDTEVRMYNEVLPAMVKTLKDVGECIDFPRLIHASPKPNTILILENVHPLGWLSFKKYRSTYEDVTATVHAIAKFHALSYFLNETSIDLSTFKSLNKVQDLPGNSFTSFADEVETWANCEKFSLKFQLLEASVQEKLKQVLKANSKSHGYNVLNHGAIHPKNLFYKVNSTGLVMKTMLIDFQRCHWGSPAIDLLYLLDLVVKHDVKVAKRDEIIYQYYQHFVEILNKIGFLGTVPSLVDLHIELLRKGFLEVFHDVEQLGDSDLKIDQYQSMIRTDMMHLLYKGILN